MRYLKRQSTNRRLIAGRGVVYDQYEQLIIPGTGSILVPKGDTASRPNPAEVGSIRYNTDTRSFEYYEGVPGGGNAWKQARFREPVTVTTQQFTGADDQETNFGPLNASDVDFYYPALPQQVLVMVENVLQIPNTNYTIVQQPCFYSSPQIGFHSNYNGSGAIIGRNNIQINFLTKGYHAGQTITVTGSQNNNGTYTITEVGTDVSYSDPAFPNNISYIKVEENLTYDPNSGGGYTISVTGTNSSQGGPYQQTITVNNQSVPAFYINFGTPVPTGKPVTVLHNFDK